MLLFFEPIAIILNILIWMKEGMPPLHILIHSIQSILFYPLGALWYLWALLLAIWVDYYLEYRIGLNIKLLWIIALALYAIGLFGNSYYYIVQGTSFEYIFAMYLKAFKSFRNVFHYGLLMVLIGKRVYYTYTKNKYSSSTLVMTTCMLYLVYVLELSFLKDKAFADDGSMFVILPLFTAFFVMTFLQHHKQIDSTRTIRNLSTGVYLLHREILYILTYGIMLYNVYIHSICKFLLVGGLSIVTCLLSYRFNWKISKYLK